MKQTLFAQENKKVVENRADGMSATISVEQQPEEAFSLGRLFACCNQQKAGINIGNVFVSLEALLLASILICNIVMIKK